MTDTSSPAPALATRPVAPQQLAWLRHELADWTSEGLIGEEQAARIAARYRSEHHARVSVGRVLLYLGGGFVGVGLIWLVAANLDELSPLARFAAVAALWLAFLVGGETLAARHASPPAGRRRTTPRRARCRRRHLPGRPVAAGPGLRAATHRPLGRRRVHPRLPDAGPPALPRRCRHRRHLVVHAAPVGRPGRDHGRRAARRRRRPRRCPRGPARRVDRRVRLDLAHRRAAAWRSRRSSSPRSPTRAATA